MRLRKQAMLWIKHKSFEPFSFLVLLSLPFVTPRAGRTCYVVVIRFGRCNDVIVFKIRDFENEFIVMFHFQDPPFAAAYA
jgi:hypothetical protein